jgi:hypothetical protein
VKRTPRRTALKPSRSRKDASALEKPNADGK